MFPGEQITLECATNMEKDLYLNKLGTTEGNQA